ncbi:MAG: putative DNA binding domain-containing protein [Sandaracinaceae bacterium]|nr:putative DNA binding domain-containing protein [Sandaracinaceae bacterium]
MADLDELLRAIEAGEDAHLELKSVARAPGNLPDKDDVAKALCAFANAGGGRLVLGVEDDGTVTGIGDRTAGDQLQRHVAQIARDLVPPLFVDQALVMHEGARLLVVTVPAFLPERPFKSRHRLYIRDHNQSREMTREEEVRAYTSVERVSFDEQSIDRTTLDDLDLAEVSATFRAAYPSYREENRMAHLRAAHCVAGRHLTVTGALLFTASPTTWIRGAFVNALQFPGTVSSTTVVASERIEGPLRHQLARTVDFIVARVGDPSARSDVVRQPAGIRRAVWVEAVANALQHRDYRSPSTTRVFVFADRVEIINPGELLNRLTVEGVRLAGTSQLRNPNLAAVLARAGQRDNAGLGVPEIFQAVVELGLPEPQIRVAHGEFALTVPLPPGP